MPARSRHPRPTHVFINCPFDKNYEKLFLALIAGLTGLGLTPRCVLEIPPNRSRLERLFELIERCASSVHDLSRVELSLRRPRVPRFNMPFELAWLSRSRSPREPIGGICWKPGTIGCKPV